MILETFFLIPRAFLSICQMAQIGLFFATMFPIKGLGFEPTSVELRQTGIFEGRPTD